MHPLDVVKTRLQIQTAGSNDAYTGISHCFRSMYRAEGWDVLNSFNLTLHSYRADKGHVCDSDAQHPSRQHEIHRKIKMSSVNQMKLARMKSHDPS